MMPSGATSRGFGPTLLDIRDEEPDPLLWTRTAEQLWTRQGRGRWPQLVVTSVGGDL